jgi:hypothetical protein
MFSVVVIDKFIILALIFSSDIFIEDITTMINIIIYSNKINLVVVGNETTSFSFVS